MITPDLLTNIIRRKYAACLYCIHSDLQASSKTCRACFGEGNEVLVRVNFELDTAMYNKFFGGGE